ncbi:nuclear transport factor 2 family protein [Nocardia flavorosea]|uniref:nuclear transport factor 2 family protein n=1 Tax=Nocardia flavorosea TaxID=53429 RepID=UPI0024576FE7|nr:nuclear transport factor 2 family protein [Nocardia flavorosea]
MPEDLADRELQPVRCGGRATPKPPGAGQRRNQCQFRGARTLYAGETDVRHPFAPLGETPLHSRARLRSHFAEEPTRTTGVERFEPVGQVHETADPEMGIYELRYAGSAHGRPFSIPCLFVVRVRDGLIVESRDYTDHVAFARAFGRLGNLATALVADPR